MYFRHKLIYPAGKFFNYFIQLCILLNHLKLVIMQAINKDKNATVIIKSSRQILFNQSAFIFV